MPAMSRTLSGPARLLAVIAVLAGGLLTTGCGQGEAKTEAPPPERVAQVRTIVLEPRRVVDRASLPADLVPMRRATLAAEVGGRVEAVRADLGQAVADGALLATIDERSLAQQAAEAEAWLRQAQLKNERAEALFARRAITQAQLLDAVTSRDVAEARLANARLQLDKARVRAPWAGRVAARHVEVGDFVAPGTPLFELVDSSRLKVRALARSADVRYLEVGREVEVRVDAYTGEVFRARVERLGAELDPASRTLTVEAEIRNPNGQLRPGMLARLEVPRQELDGALVVPLQAVIDLEGGKAVYVVEDERAQRRTVELGAVVGEEVVVEGLAAGARVIVEGHHVVGPGQKVEEV
jgi:RND family efflux transporter MFP subunit